MMIHISKHKPGNANAIGPFAKIASPNAAAAIYNCLRSFSSSQVNALNKPSVIKQIKQFAIEHDMKDYEVVQSAIKDYLARNK